MLISSSTTRARILIGMSSLALFSRSLLMECDNMEKMASGKSIPSRQRCIAYSESMLHLIHDSLAVIQCY